MTEDELGVTWLGRRVIVTTHAEIDVTNLRHRRQRPALPEEEPVGRGDEPAAVLVGSLGTDWRLIATGHVIR